MKVDQMLELVQVLKNCLLLLFAGDNVQSCVPQDSWHQLMAYFYVLLKNKEILQVRNVHLSLQILTTIININVKYEMSQAQRIVPVLITTEMKNISIKGQN